MAEKQFITHKADITSFEAREAMLGVLSPGRYRGYSTITTGGTPAAGVIPIHLNHTGTGIQKGTHANPPALSDKTGVVVTPQGTIIHNTDTDIDVGIDEGITSTRIDLIYVEHEYYDVQGANPSIIGVKKGTPGGGTPTLSKPAEQVAIIKVTISSTAVIFGDLVFEALAPALLGDYDIDGEIQDIITSVIGDRIYAEENYITSGETLTESIDKLDISLKDEEEARIVVGDRDIGSVDWGVLTDITNNDVSESAHGLAPKAPGLTGSDYKYLSGEADWRSLLDDASKVVPASSLNSADWDEVSMDLANNNSGFIDVTSKLPANFVGGLAIIRVYGITNSSTGGEIHFWNNAPDAGKGPCIRVSTGIGTTQDTQMIVPISADKKIYWSGIYTDNINSLDIIWQGYIETTLS